MYLEHYHLEKKPFGLSPGPAFFWLSEKHKEALATLRYGVMGDLGFLLLTGEVGVGKTALIHRLLSTLDSSTIVAHITDPGLGVNDFFRLLAAEFKIDTPFSSKGEFLIILEQFLRQADQDHKKVLLIVDEIQRVSNAMLDQIRVLSNIELEDRKLINIFLIGQPEFKNILLEPVNRAIRQRIAVYYHVPPLTEEETGQYIEHRLKIAGAKKRIFLPDAVRELHRISKGFPRGINILCDHALLTGFASGLETINSRIILECGNDLNIERENSLPRPETGPISLPRPKRPKPDATATPKLEVKPQPSPPPPETKGTNKWAYPLVIVIGITVVALAGYYFLFPGTGGRRPFGEPTAPPATTQMSGQTGTNPPPPPESPPQGAEVPVEIQANEAPGSSPLAPGQVAEPPEETATVAMLELARPTSPSDIVIEQSPHSLPQQAENAESDATTPSDGTGEGSMLAMADAQENTAAPLPAQTDQTAPSNVASDMRTDEAVTSQTAGDTHTVPTEETNSAIPAQAEGAQADAVERGTPPPAQPASSTPVPESSSQVSDLATAGNTQTQTESPRPSVDTPGENVNAQQAQNIDGGPKKTEPAPPAVKPAPATKPPPAAVARATGQTITPAPLPATTVVTPPLPTVTTPPLPDSGTVSETVEKAETQQDMETRLQSFLQNYCSTYSSKDLNGFTRFFASDALENGKPIENLWPKYERNFSFIDTIYYRIELKKVMQAKDGKMVKINGDFFLRWLPKDKTWRENAGNIYMTLEERGPSFVVHRLDYHGNKDKN